MPLGWRDTLPQVGCSGKDQRRPLRVAVPFPTCGGSDGRGLRIARKVRLHLPSVLGRSPLDCFSDCEPVPWQSPISRFQGNSPWNCQTVPVVALGALPPCPSESPGRFSTPHRPLFPAPHSGRSCGGSVGNIGRSLCSRCGRWKSCGSGHNGHGRKAWRNVPLVCAGVKSPPIPRTRRTPCPLP